MQVLWSVSGIILPSVCLWCCVLWLSNSLYFPRELEGWFNLVVLWTFSHQTVLSSVAWSTSSKEKPAHVFTLHFYIITLFEVCFPISQHMTPILHQLYWLPIRQRILFKTAVLVYKCRHGMAPSYLSTSSHDGRCHLRSAASGQLSVPRTTTNYGDRSFAVSGPTAWNSLPAALRLDISCLYFVHGWKHFWWHKLQRLQQSTWHIFCIFRICAI